MPQDRLLCRETTTGKGWTVRESWREVARLGGFLARKSDGEPGWQTVWRGWQKLDLLTIGASLAESPLPSSASRFVDKGKS